jgi:hypothetical protein
VRVKEKNKHVKTTSNFDVLVIKLISEYATFQCVSERVHNAILGIVSRKQICSSV